MMSEKRSKSCCEREMGEDRISNLPEHITDHILSYLPIKEAGKTSLLTRKWRYKWTTIPCLVFRDQSFTVLQLVRDIDRILLLHSGPICKFFLSYCQGEISVDDLNRWILHISRHPIQEFTLITKHSEVFKVPSCFFSCQNLTRLHLHDCLLELPPSTFKGFKGLKSLTLVEVSLQQDVFNILTSSCTLGELCLMKVSGVDHFNIDAPNLHNFVFQEPSFYSDNKGYQVDVNAPNLQVFLFDGCSDNLSLKKTSRLTKFSIRTHELNPGHDITLLKHLADVPQVETLIISCFSFEYLHFSVIPRALPTPYLYLHTLDATINFSSLKGTSGLRCLLRSVPNLQQLIMASLQCRIWQSISSNIWQADQWNCPFNLLQIVEFSCLRGTKDEIDFIRFILLTSPLLVKMFVKHSISLASGCKTVYGPNTDTTDFEFVKQLQSLKRASPQAQIIFK